jgi:hypothetical protein
MDNNIRRENIIINEGKYIPRKFIVKITILECRNLEIISGEPANPYVEVDVKIKNKI